MNRMGDLDLQLHVEFPVKTTQVQLIPSFLIFFLT